MDRLKAVLTAASALLFVLSPYYSGAFSGYRPDQFPVPQDNPPIQPAGYAFAIWGLIYALLILHAGFGLLKRDTDSRWDAPRWFLIISLTLGASWLSVAQISPLWATVLIWIMLLGALGALIKSSDKQDRWLLQLPIGIYAGWLTAASFVSIGLIGTGYGVITNETGWALVALVAALIFTCAFQAWLRRAPEFGLAVAWAVLAIIVKNWGTQIEVSVAALIGVVAILATVLLTLRGKRNRATAGKGTV